MIYTGSPLNKEPNNNYGPTKDAAECQTKCQETEECTWFNWDGDCHLKTGKGNKKEAEGKFTGPAQCKTKPEPLGKV